MIYKIRRKIAEVVILYTWHLKIIFQTVKDMNEREKYGNFCLTTA